VSDLNAFLPILVLLVLATMLAVAISLLAFLAGPKHPTAAKSAPYESGIVPLEPAPQRFPVKFLRVAMLFLIFDIETVAFFPWAVLLRQLRVFGLLEMATFLLILGIGYVYVWKKGGFQWE